MRSVHPIFPVQRLEEIRGLGPYLTYDELQGWYWRLPLTPAGQDLPVRTVQSRSGRAYGVSLVRRRAGGTNMASVCLAALDGAHRTFFRGRTVYSRKADPAPDYLFLQDSDYELAWREASPSKLEVVPIGVTIGIRNCEPPAISVEARKTPLWVVTAERLALDAASAIIGDRQLAPVTSS